MMRGVVGMIGVMMMLWLGGCAVQDRAYVAEVDQWAAARVERLRSDTGWLTLVGLHPLSQGTQTLGRAPDNDIVIEGAPVPRLGTLDVIGTNVTFVADRMATVELDDQRIVRQAMVVDSAGAPTVLVAEPIRFFVIDRGGKLYLRVKDRNADTLARFKGIERYQVDPRWRVQARVVPGTAGTITVPNILGQTSEARSPGALAFELAGETCRLTPQLLDDGRLFFVFGDATNGRGTYPGGRFLDAEAIGADGTVMLDFNKAHSPMCAFTAFATCEMPPAGNTLPIAVEAGEQYPLPE